MSDPQFAESGEMVTASLRGYRSWVLRVAEPGMSTDYDKGWILGSVGVGTHWESREITADCVKYGSKANLKGITASFMYKGKVPEQHNAPHNGCTCGIYGWYEPEWANAYHSGSIMGVVEYSGRILMGSKGFRAEKAKIIAVTMGASKVARDQFCKSVHFIEYVQKFLEIVNEGTKNSVVKVNYGGLQKFLSDKMDAEKKSFEHTMRRVIESMGIEYFETYHDMKEKYPPQLDTVENIIGSKLKRYDRGGSPFC